VEGEYAMPWEEEEGSNEEGEECLKVNETREPSSGLTSERDGTSLRTRL